MITMDIDKVVDLSPLTLNEDMVDMTMKIGVHTRQHCVPGTQRDGKLMRTNQIQYQNYRAV